MKLLIDMNLTPRWVAFLAAVGRDAVHWSAIGPVGAPDCEIMAYARAYDLVVLTHDLDFGSILAATQGEKPSVAQVRAGDTSPEAIGAQVLKAIGLMAAELEAGALVTIEPARARVRLLPFARREGGA